MRPVFIEWERRRRKQKSARAKQQAGLEIKGRLMIQGEVKEGKMDIKDSAGLIIVMVPPMWTEALWCRQENAVLVTSIINHPGSMSLQPRADPFLQHFFSTATYPRGTSPCIAPLTWREVRAQILWVRPGHLLATFLRRNKSNLTALLKG